MREKYESLSLAVLKDLAKARGMKGISTLRKPALIERMLEEDVKESDRGNPEEVHKSTPAENTVKEKSYDSEKTEYRTRPAGEGLQEQRKEYRSDKNEQEHRSTNIRREYNREYNREATRENGNVPSESTQLDSGEKANGILEVLPDGYGFIRCENYMPGENDIYVSLYTPYRVYCKKYLSTFFLYFSHKKEKNLPGRSLPGQIQHSCMLLF